MTDANPTKFKKLVTLLRELFQLDQPDLDFGIYRIMHAKAGEVTQFLERDLLPQVKEAFAGYQSADSSELKKKLEQLTAQITEAGMNPEDSPKVRELREQLKGAIDLGALENETYDHLYSFFRRYYSEGDFLAKRVYKPGVYAIPYEGEEVTLHWANKDQYYIKTSEYLRDYAFRLKPEAGDGEDPMRVHFKLVGAAEGEHGNVKAAEGKERVFVLAAEDFIRVEDGELELRFEYRTATLEDWPADQRVGKKKPPAQKDLTAAAVQRVLASGTTFAAWLAELKKPHTKADGEQAEYSRLDAHLRRYSARNTFDYFIHKDLGGFLRRELDFYIKNEVMHLDDVESEAALKVEQYLSKIKVIRRIAGKILDFVEQLESFQKKLWLKRKFVVNSSWLVALSQVPEELLPEVCANTAQLQEWKLLHSLHELPADITRPAYSEPLTPAYLRGYPSLMVDTQHFSEEFSARLLDAVDELDVRRDGVLVHSENFHGLRFLKPAFTQQVKSIYIDPPYNTDASPIIYKNGYRRSSWAALMANRIEEDLDFRARDCIRCIAIDDFELADLHGVLDSSANEQHLATAVVRSKPQGRPTTTGFSANHEYAVFWGRDGARVGRLPREGTKAERYPYKDDKGIYSWANFRKSGTDSDRQDRRRSFYPIYVSQTGALRVPSMEWNEHTDSWDVADQRAATECEVWPLDEDGREKVWNWSASRVREELEDFRAEIEVGGKVQVYKKYRPNQDGALPGTWWDAAAYSASESGTKLLKEMFGEKSFDYPKSLGLVVDCLRACSLTPNSVALDYFGGSGTTAHAVIQLNREDNGRRRFLLIEAGKHFEDVLVPRVKKAAFADAWKDGRPERIVPSEEVERGPQWIKVLHLESYEDTLNNLALSRSTQQQGALNFAASQGADSLREDYILRYQLDVESRGSASLLKVAAFSDPTAYKLRVKAPGSDESREVNVDLLETFNWLLGLTVQQIAASRSFIAEFERDSEGRLQLKGRLKQDAAGPWWFRTVTGTTPEGRKTLVIWRKLTGDAEQDNLVLETWFRDKQAFSVKDSEFDLIYVNGDNTLENLRLPDESWKVRLTEEDFQRLMFEGTD